AYPVIIIAIVVVAGILQRELKGPVDIKIDLGMIARLGLAGERMIPVVTGGDRLVVIVAAALDIAFERMVAQGFDKAHLLTVPAGHIVGKEDSHFVGAARCVAAAFETSRKGHPYTYLSRGLLCRLVVGCAVRAAHGDTNAISAGNVIGAGIAGSP